MFPTPATRSKKTPNDRRAGGSRVSHPQRSTSSDTWKFQHAPDNNALHPGTGAVRWRMARHWSRRRRPACHPKLQRRMVRARGLEPLILAEPDPKSGVSANSTTRASSFRLRRRKKNLKWFSYDPGRLPMCVIYFSPADWLWPETRFDLPIWNIKTSSIYFTFNSRWIPNFSIRLRRVARVMPSNFAAWTWLLAVSLSAWITSSRSTAGMIFVFGSRRAHWNN
jgi:hypothetical protein